MGFGHRVYKEGDPRAAILKQMSAELTAETGRPELYEMSAAMEEYMHDRKGLIPNVDFYSATVYYSMGIPIDHHAGIRGEPGRRCPHPRVVFEQRIYCPRGNYVGPRTALRPDRRALALPGPRELKNVESAVVLDRITNIRRRPRELEVAMDDERERLREERRKDCLIQARVPRGLRVLEAAKRAGGGLPCPFIRNVLEDAFQLVVDVVANVRRDRVRVPSRRQAPRRARRAAPGRRGPRGRRRAGHLTESATAADATPDDASPLASRPPGTASPRNRAAIARAL
jgi:hypothetical protein